MSCINIKRIRLVNYKAFVDETIQCNPNLNIYVGDNGTGKSSILQALTSFETEQLLLIRPALRHRLAQHVYRDGFLQGPGKDRMDDLRCEQFEKCKRPDQSAWQPEFAKPLSGVTVLWGPHV